jgi:S1-C subfamily serine protease
MLVVGIVLALAGAQPAAGGHVSSVTPAMEAPSEARALSRAFAGVAHAIGPSVVRIEVQTARERGTASGIVLDTRGYVVTSSHVLEGAPKIDVEIIFPDGRRMAADVVGRDAPSDVAVVRLRTPPEDLSAARFGDSDEAQIGEWVLAVGSPLGLEQTITAGIISGRGPLEGGDGIAAQVYLQTDAKVNPGNSGGPLVNLDGEVVGLAALISAGPGGSYGYAVPINLVRRTATALIEGGHMMHPYIGVALRDVRDLDRAEIRRWSGAGARVLPPRGSLVTRVMRGAPAALAGLRAGDVITSIDNRDIPTTAELSAIISGTQVGAHVMVGVIRAGAGLTLPLSVADRPATTRSPS